MQLRVSEKLVESILLCDPITSRGKEKLKELGLLEELSSKDFFSNDKEHNLWVPPIDLENQRVTESTPYDLEIRFEDNYSHERFAERRAAFYRYFEGREGNSVTVIIGSDGSGKTIELHRQVINKFGQPPFQSFGSRQSTPNAILIDLEKDILSVFSERTYVNPKHDEPIWLFCTAALDTLLNYIAFLASEHNEELCSAYNNLTEYFFSNSDYRVRTATRFESELIKDISSWAKTRDPDQWETIRQKIIDMLQSAPKKDSAKRVTSIQAGKEDIMLVLWLLFLISFCSNPTDDKMILIDNIEDYIAIKTPIVELRRPLDEGNFVFEKEITEIYNCLDQTKNRIDRALMNYKANICPEFNASISIVLAMRRSTYSLLPKIFYMGALSSQFDQVFDITGDISVESLWRKKYSNIWLKYLQPLCSSDVINYIEFANKVIVGGEDAAGISYTQKMMPMLGRGLRKTGHNMSVNLYLVYKVLTANRPEHITLSQFYSILSENGAARYMLRQGLIEYYYMIQFSRTLEEYDLIGQRWRLLNIGHLGPQKISHLIGPTGKPTSRTFVCNSVMYNDRISDAEAAKPVDNPSAVSTYRSLLWRILGALSVWKAHSSSESITPEYQEQTLRSLLHKILPTSTKQGFTNVSNVLVGMCIPDNKGDYSPYAFLQMQDTISRYMPVDYSLSEVLKDEWDGVNDVREDSTNWSQAQHSIKITEEGEVFLLQWMASFSFFSALYCNNFAPLFFVTSKDVIIHILHSVYNNALIQRDCYRKEARLFNTLQTNERWQRMPPEFLLRIENKYMSFETRVHDLHLGYLQLYKDYITQCYMKMGISKEDKNDIISTILYIIKRYNDEWKGDVLCF